jgi:cobyric acid synthase
MHHGAGHHQRRRQKLADHGLCRYYARQGLKVAPFKAQNMSNNARVVASSNGRAKSAVRSIFRRWRRVRYPMCA